MTVLFPHTVHLNIYGSHLPDEQTSGALMSWHWLAISQIVVKEWDIKKKKKKKYTGLN